MNRVGHSVERGALIYELKRFIRPFRCRRIVWDFEWSPPRKSIVASFFIITVLMIFCGVYLYWDLPQVVYFAAVIPMYFARRAWRERDPLLRDPPSSFMTSIGFSMGAWQRASLFVGLLLSFLFGCLLAYGVIQYYLKVRLGLPQDKDLFVSIASLPLLCSLFFLIHYGLERKREVVPLKNREHLITKIQRGKNRFIIKGVNYLPLLPLITLMMLLLSLRFDELMLYIFLIWIGMVIVLVRMTISLEGRESNNYFLPILMTGAIVFYAGFLFCLENFGGKAPLSPLLNLARGIKPLFVIILLSIILLITVWTMVHWSGAGKHSDICSRTKERN